MTVALVALPKPKEGLGPLSAWILCNRKSLPCRPTIQGLDFYMRAEERSAPYQARFSQPVGGKLNPLLGEAELCNRDL